MGSALGESVSYYLLVRGRFSTKFVIQPSGAWAVKYHRRVGPIEARPAGHHTGPHSSLVAEVHRMINNVPSSVRDILLHLRPQHISMQVQVMVRGQIHFF